MIQVSCCGCWNSRGYWWRAPATKTLRNKAKWNCDPGKLLHVAAETAAAIGEGLLPQKHYVTRRNGIMIQVSCCGCWDSRGYWWRNPATKHYVTCHHVYWTLTSDCRSAYMGATLEKGSCFGCWLSCCYYWGLQSNIKVKLMWMMTQLEKPRHILLRPSQCRQDTLSETSKGGEHSSQLSFWYMKDDNKKCLGSLGIDFKFDLSALANPCMM